MLGDRACLFCVKPTPSTANKGEKQKEKNWSTNYEQFWSQTPYSIGQYSSSNQVPFYQPQSSGILILSHHCNFNSSFFILDALCTQQKHDAIIIC